MKNDRRAKPSAEMQAALKARFELHARCRFFLPGHGAENYADELARQADYLRAHPDAQPDRYGSGEFLERLEREVAGILGKEAALFFVSGTMAQQIALRIWCEKSGNPRIALHATSHLEQHEHHGYARLHRLESRLLGRSDRPFTAVDLRTTEPAPAAAVLELPYRELGGATPAWDELLAIRAAASTQNTKLHLDGARLWEVAPAYGRSPAAIAALFDSVYVSFYKGLGAVTGAMLAGDANFIEEARVWQRRHGGNLFTVHPYALSAKLALDLRLPRFPDYFRRAGETARLLNREGEGFLEVGGGAPASCLFHVRFPGVAAEGRARLAEARDRVARERGTWLLNGFQANFSGEQTSSELTIGDGALALSDEELRASLRLFREYASGASPARSR